MPVLKAFCLESYSEPEEVYSTVKRRGMNLVTLTDHDSLDGCEALRAHTDFFPSEEVTCRMPSGTEAHIAETAQTEIVGRDIRRAALRIFLRSTTRNSAKPKGTRSISRPRPGTLFLLPICLFATYLPPSPQSSPCR